MEDYARGAASSLNKTIGELGRFVGRSSSQCQSAESGLRGRLDELIWEIGRRGFEAGFKEAHAQCARHVEEHSEFPTTISYSGRHRFSPSAEGLVTVRASVIKMKIFKLPSFDREVSFWERFRRS